MRLPDSLLLLNSGQSLKPWKKKKYVASKYIVFTDSLSCIQALQSIKLEHPLIGMMIRKYVFLNCAKKYVIFVWVLSHIGIMGNERADSAVVCTGLASCQGWSTL